MLEQLAAIIGKENILTEEPMAKHTTFRIGGPARYFVTVHTKEQLMEVLTLLQDKEMPYYLLGNGSNLLVGDGGYDGVIVHLASEFQIMIVDVDATAADGKYRMEVGAGVMLSKAAHCAIENDLAGMEFASGIPGTVGGAVVMNAGAYDGEMRLVVESVRLLCGKKHIITKSNEEMAFGYRSSILKFEEYKDAIVLSVTFALSKGEPADIKGKTDEFTKQRQTKQPLEYPSAGSTFKRPEGYYAGKLIADAGLRGFRVGDAQVSEKHCGFVINRGAATAADVRSLMQQVEEKVYDQFGVKLEPEVIFLGKF